MGDVLLCIHSKPEVPDENPMLKSIQQCWHYNDLSSWYYLVLVEGEPHEFLLRPELVAIWIRACMDWIAVKAFWLVILLVILWFESKQSTGTTRKNVCETRKGIRRVMEIMEIRKKHIELLRVCYILQFKKWYLLIIEYTVPRRIIEGWALKYEYGRNHHRTARNIEFQQASVQLWLE